jgi:integrase
VQSFVDKKTGLVFHYFRRRGCKRVRLPGMPGSAAFMAAYQNALDQPQYVEIGAAKRSIPGSISAAMAGYYTSNDFTTLAPGTQSMRRAILERFRAEHGDKPIGTMPTKFIVLALNKMRPFAAKSWLKSIRHLMQFALKLEMIRTDPTQGIKLKAPRTDGIHTWSEQNIAAFEAVHPVGTKARLAFALLLYTAQRRGDVVRMGRQHIRDGVIQVRQEKTGAELSIPVHSDLRAIIAATPGEHLTFLVTQTNRPYSGNDFSGQFRAWCDAAGLPKECSAHGLRKAACRRLAEAGCSAHEIAAISGHMTLSEVQRYTRAVDQAKLAKSAMERQAAAKTLVF